MGLIVGNGILISTVDTLCTCPICEQQFDVGPKIEKSKTPCFKMRCPKCKGKITVLIPLFSSDGLQCWETDCPPSATRLQTITGPKIETL